MNREILIMLSYAKKQSVFTIIISIILFMFASLFLTSPAAASEKNDFEFDLTKKKKQEYEVELENGEVGVIGIEPAKVQPSDISPGTTAWRTYYYTTGLSAEYYTDIYLPSTNGEASIKRVYGGDYTITAGSVTDNLSIDRKNQNGNLPARTSYTLHITPVLGGDKTAQLITEVTGTTVKTSQKGFWF